MIRKIISGGQTGVDQAALDAAIACAVAHGGSLPSGRKTEDGPLPGRYNLVELASPSYPARTRKNVVDGDATLIITRGELRGGSALTAAIAEECGKPWLHVDIGKHDRVQVVAQIKMWLQETNPYVLNVAGPRASSDARIYGEAYEIVLEILKEAGRPLGNECG